MVEALVAMGLLSGLAIYAGQFSKSLSEANRSALARSGQMRVMDLLVNKAGNRMSLEKGDSYNRYDFPEYFNCAFPSTGSVCNANAWSQFSLTDSSGSRITGDNLNAYAGIPRLYNFDGSSCNGPTVNDAGTCPLFAWAEFKAHCPGGVASCNQPDWMALRLHVDPVSGQTKIPATGLNIRAINAMTSPMISIDLPLESAGGPGEDVVPYWKLTGLSTTLDRSPSLRSQESGEVAVSTRSSPGFSQGVALEVQHTNDVPEQGLNVTGSVDNVTISNTNTSPGGNTWWIDSSGGTSGWGQGNLNFGYGAFWLKSPLMQLEANGRVSVGGMTSKRFPALYLPDPNLVVTPSSAGPEMNWLAALDSANVTFAVLGQAAAPSPLSPFLPGVNLGSALWAQSDLSAAASRKLTMWSQGVGTVFGNQGLRIVSRGGHVNLTGERSASVAGLAGLFSASANLYLLSSLGIVSANTAGETRLKSRSGAIDIVMAGSTATTGNVTLQGTNAIRLSGANISVGCNLPSTDCSIVAPPPLIASDSRYKEEVETITSGLDLILSLRPVSYHLKADSSARRHMGFIAQEVQSVAPNLVGKIDRKRSLLGLNYIGLIAPLVSGVQELKARIDQRHARIAALQAEVNQQQQRLANLRQLLDQQDARGGQ